MTTPITLTQELVRFDTVNPPGHERACAEHLARLLESAGFGVEVVPFGDGRAQVIARLGGAADARRDGLADPRRDGLADPRPLAFTGHLDTVPLGARPWSVDPLAGEIKDGKLYGRGSSDMKSGVAAFVCAALDLADRLDGTPGVLLVITAGEETGCSGADALAADPRPLSPAGALVVAEPTGNQVLVGHKGALWLEAETAGVTAHGSMPEKGINAVYKMARAVTALEQFDFNVARHDVLGGATLNVGTVTGGLNINSVPDRAAIGIDIRTIPAVEHDAIRAQLEAYLGPDVTLRTVMDARSVWTDPDDPWIGEVRRIAEGVTGAPSPVAAAPYFTDASALTPVLGAPPTVILGPGELALAHQTDEYCLTARIDEAAEIYRRLIASWCGL